MNYTSIVLTRFLQIINVMKFIGVLENIDIFIMMFLIVLLIF
jgi:hypothetical protein